MIWLDGVAMGGNLFYPGAPATVKKSGVHIGSGVELPFSFGKQELTGASIPFVSQT